MSISSNATENVNIANVLQENSQPVSRSQSTVRPNVTAQNNANVENSISREEIAQMIAENVQLAFSNLNLQNLAPHTSDRNANISQSSLQTENTFPRNVDRNDQRHFQTLFQNLSNSNPPTFSQGENRHNHLTNVNFQNPVQSNFNLSQDIENASKVARIIQSWQLKFDGSSQGLTIEEFLYRIRTLTAQWLNNNFDLICKNLGILLFGKAREWFWRYHKRVREIRWEDFCQAIRYEYKDYRSDWDIKEELKSLKQKPTDCFEFFYDKFCSVADRLSVPLEEQEMIEILSRNLRTEIRHELLYVPIMSLAHLRKLCQMRENLLKEECFRRNQNPYRRNIAAVDELAENVENLVEGESSVDAIHILKCWNCDEEGHRWDDCLKDRKIFCYGCGAKEIYKPNCSYCQNKKLGNSNRVAFNNNRSQPK